MHSLRGYFVAADNAYPSSNNLLVPFRARKIRTDTIKSAYNFFLSLMRIRIEIAFGLLTQKFRVFCCPLAIATSRVHVVAHAAMRLRFLCVHERVAGVDSEVR
jgi:hypothetical protein